MSAVWERDEERWKKPNAYTDIKLFPGASMAATPRGLFR
jgi:hypothetical protein